ncbi:MAG TPA: histidine kinase [Chitinophagaceae bacterium]|nr:histidine kinase [Chitinophagaceae bacterium]
MKITVDRKRATIYLWIGLAYMILWSLYNAHRSNGNFFAVLLNNTWKAFYLVILNYIFFEFTLPYVLRKRKHILLNIALAIVALFVHLLLWSYGLYAWRLFGIELHIYTPIGSFSSIEKALENQMAFSSGSVFFFGIIRHIYNYVKLKQATQLLLIEKKEAELNYLKSQTNPHFLFNTLNNIYSLSRDKSDLAPESILRLSKILRFMLYETSGAYISVEQELKIITDYIELEKLRYDDSLRISLKNDIEDLKQALPPLLLIPLVENAFKHGVSETRQQPFLDIHLAVNKRQLIFTVKNSTGANTTENEVKENIGLSNLRRQLELLYKEYELSVQQSGSVFTALLKINLASHV